MISYKLQQVTSYFHTESNKLLSHSMSQVLLENEIREMTSLQCSMSKTNRIKGYHKTKLEI